MSQLKNKNKITTTVYRKPNTSTKIINNKCNTPFQYKLATIRSHIHRVILVCSKEQLLNEEIKFIMDIAENARYKRTLIKNIV